MSEDRYKVEAEKLLNVLEQIDVMMNFGPDERKEGLGLIAEALEQAEKRGIERAAEVAIKWREDHDYEFFVGGDILEIAEAIRALASGGK